MCSSGCRRLELKCRARLRIPYGAQCVVPSSQTLTVNCFGPRSSKTVARTLPFSRVRVVPSFRHEP
eukprot:scaffold5159_cov111-Phaeocystis_antarctica.AAC.1